MTEKSMTKDLQTFTSEEFGQLRTVTIDGEIWFVGKDVAVALGYSNTKDAIIRHIDDDDKGKSQITTTSGVQEMTIINESGLYSLILSSKLPSAKRFKRWITSEVLPTIRKTGSYALITTDTLSSKERIQIARLIAYAPKGRLDAVRKVLEPLIGEVTVNTSSEREVSRLLFGDSEAIGDAVAKLIEDPNTLKRSDNTVAVDRDVFKTTMANYGLTYEQSLRALDEMGMIKRSSEGKRTTPVYTNGTRLRCVILRTDAEEE